MAPLYYLLIALLTLINIHTQASTLELGAPTSLAYKFSKPNCNTTCGNLTIPYPFGTSKGCYLQNKYNSFLITCRQNIPYLAKSYIKVSNISLDDHHIHILGNVSRLCYDEWGNFSDIRNYIRLSKFRVDSEHNKFTVIGCSTSGRIEGSQVQDYNMECKSSCDGVESVVNGSCSGIGCCQVPLPVGTRDFNVSFSNSRDSFGKRACSSAFIVEEGAYNFSSLDLAALRETSYPIMLDWAVGNETCALSKKNKTSYACVASGSTCTDSKYGPSAGYKCSCPYGFEGNPYLTNGCLDIDKCAKSNPCNSPAKCQNQHRGMVLCVCPPGYQTDGRRGCYKLSHSTESIQIGPGIAIGASTTMFVLVVGGSWIYWKWTKKRHMKQKQKFFMQNGGFALREELSKDNGLAETARLFSEEELKTATNNFNEHGIIGRGGCGTVYKGVLSANNIVVAIKKSKVSEQTQISQFINEMIILCRINHINVVRLIGCCLETEVPLLVYEFINNGTLSNHIHNKVDGSYLSWECCLRIAAEIAGAVAYLHSAASPPIIHRDIKSTNILLDENLVAKVADFGASKIVPKDHAEIATLVQGTFGYIDPEYLYSSELTEKSDVYSFGVVLAEMLTGERAISFNRPEEDRNLAVYFISSMKLGNGMPNIIHKSFVGDEKNTEQVKQVVMMAARCLKVTGNERPSMRELAMELERLKTIMVEPPWPDNSSTNINETRYLQTLSLPPNVVGSTNIGSSTITEFEDLNVEITEKEGSE
ncbi:putative wall-associated receptor kinase-like 16 [Heracleum sosnowskyi]|uniref:Wall-associated receptor kinase-like 16 n=1 Tax=Heracleum sosnowskyi TaxID=360622 RepID=A0AAD8JFM2_9APIA|nr:putative wall-associated receptor kinase-like 16 [Heracleum sosnowskyi]